MCSCCSGCLQSRHVACFRWSLFLSMIPWDLMHANSSSSKVKLSFPVPFFYYTLIAILLFGKKSYLTVQLVYREMNCFISNKYFLAHLRFWLLFVLFYICLANCDLSHIFNIFSRTSGSISSKFGKKHFWVEGFQISLKHWSGALPNKDAE